MVRARFGISAGGGWLEPGRTWHHRRTLRPAVTGDVRLRVGALRRTPVAGKSGSCPAREKGAGHKMGPKCARGGINRGAGHKTGGKCAREVRGRRKGREGEVGEVRVVRVVKGGVVWSSAE